MNASLFALILATRFMTASLAPMTDERAELADAIAFTAWGSEPLFREGGMQTSAIGDGGHSFCAFQIHDSSGGTRSLTTDATACARYGYKMLHASIRICRAHPVAWYAEGPHGCESARAQRISADRMALAASLSRP
jgi:hypothetical protein